MIKKKKEKWVADKSPLTALQKRGKQNNKF